MVILILIFSIIYSSSTAQTGQNGAAEIFLYSDMQPDLVNVVSSQHAVGKPFLDWPVGGQ